MTEAPETRYATTEDGVSIAYQTAGDGPVDLVLDLESWGNVDIMWELPQLADLFGRLSSFSRLILHDQRGTGLSGGGSSFPNLETRARDLLTVLDTIRSSRAALFGERTSGAALAMFAATYPDRVSSLVWFDPVATRRWSPEYPWGRTPAELRREAESTRDLIGDKSLVHDWLEGMAPSLAGDEHLEALLTRHDRHFMAPSTALEWINVEGEIDVTAVLATLRCPTLLLNHQAARENGAESRYVQSVIAGAELVLIPGDPFGMVFSDQAAIADAIDGFLLRHPKTVASETVLGSVLFTDIVGSTERQAAMWCGRIAERDTLCVTRRRTDPIRRLIEMLDA